MGSVAGVELGDDGVVRVLIANTEIGQGTNTIFPMLTAEALGIEPAKGVLRLSFVHYTSREDIDHLMRALDHVL